MSKIDSLTMFYKLKKQLGEWGGGSIPYEDVAFFEHIEANRPVIFHAKDYKEEKVIIMIVDMKTPQPKKQSPWSKFKKEVGI